MMIKHCSWLQGLNRLKNIQYNLLHNNFLKFHYSYQATWFVVIGQYTFAPSGRLSKTI
jgi:hypothetical protein